jgi:folylpolyglutamate synthase/dihydropteroate synthase
MQHQTQEVSQLKQQFAVQKNYKKQELVDKNNQINKMHMDFFNEHHKRANMELEVEALEKIKVEKEMLEQN